MHNHVVIYSGGMDSFTLLHHVADDIAPARAQGLDERLYAISFDYGQRHRRELQKAAKVTGMLGVPHRVIDLSLLRSLMQGSALTDSRVPMPHGHYAAENMKQTVVPGRNTVMLAVALSFAEGIDPAAKATIYYGAHGGDHHIYPDCRPSFVVAMGEAIKQGSDSRVQLLVPFLYLNKTTILTAGLTRLGLTPEAYADTWTCYEGGATPCGECGACQERAEAFEQNGVADPLVAAPAATA